jgi:hypothetical protein
MTGVTATPGQGFRMTIGRVIQLRQRPGFYLAGKISFGMVRTGDHLIAA